MFSLQWRPSRRAAYSSAGRGEAGLWLLVGAVDDAGLRPTAARSCSSAGADLLPSSLCERAQPDSGVRRLT